MRGDVYDVAVRQFGCPQCGHLCDSSDGEWCPLCGWEQEPFPLVTAAEAE